MPHYRVHRMKENPREHFRWAAHTGGLAVVKPRDYEAGEELDAQNPYETWKRLSSDGHPLHPGDLLESVGAKGIPDGMWIAKYIGFEPAQWFVPAAPVEAMQEQGDLPPVPEISAASAARGPGEPSPA